MHPELEAAAAFILRASPEVGVPIRTLHRTLETALGPAAGSPTRLYERLRQRDDLFLVFEPRPPSWTSDSFAAETEPDLESALKLAGIDLSPRVILRPRAAEGAAAEATILARSVEGTLTDLLDRRQEDAELDGEVLEAMRQVSALARRLAASPG